MAKTKLENLTVKKVDFVDMGADQQANILITKRDNVGEEPFYKRFFRKFCNAMNLDTEDVRKAVEAEGFGEKLAQREMDKVRDEIWNVCYALQDSLVSVLMDSEVKDKVGRMEDSLEQFTEFVKDAVTQWSSGKTSNAVREPEPADDYAVAKMQKMIEKSCGKAKKTIIKENPGTKPEEKEDKELLNVEKMTPAEKLVYEDLKKRYGTADTSMPQPENIEDTNVKDAVAKAVGAAMEEIQKNLAAQVSDILAPVRKRAEEMQEAELMEVAKKYEATGIMPDKLVPLLKSMKQVSPEAYDNFISAMDANVDAIEKSGLFSEIGKSGNDGGGTYMSSDQAWTAIEKKASDLMVKEPSLTHAQAIDRVCQANPILVHAYEKK